MKCNEFEKHIPDYLTNDDLDPELKEKIEKHYFECDKCFNSLELMSATIETIQNEGVDKLLRFYEEKETITLKERLSLLIGRLRELATDRIFPCTILSLDGVRSGKKSVEKYKIGDPFIIQLDIPADMEGHLTVLHYDEKNNLNLAFPKRTTDDTHVKAAEEKWIEMKASAPIGNHYLKAILTSKRIVEPNNIDFDNSDDIVDTIEKLIAFINEITKDEWRESVSEFEVVEV